MDYNTQRTHLNMPEYGRLIQQLIEKCKTLPTKEERNEMSEAIVDFMGQRNPSLRDEEDFASKLWDHLFIMAGFDLDVDAPYPIPTKDQRMTRPKKLDYPVLQGEFKFYGKSILQLIEMAIELEAGPQKEALIEVIANNMKKSYNIYNKEHVTDDVIFRHLKELSEDRLDLTGIDSLEKSKIYHSASRSKNQKNQGRENGQNRGRHKSQQQKNRRK